MQTSGTLASLSGNGGVTIANGTTIERVHAEDLVREGAR